MTNREWLNSLSAEALGAFLSKAISQCSLCHYQDIPECSGNCKKGITRWLNAKFEKPMAEIKIGDLLTFADKKAEYTGIVVDDNTVFLHVEEKRHYLKLLIKDCVNIRRYDCWKDEWETIWRADNAN